VDAVRGAAERLCETARRPRGTGRANDPARLRVQLADRMWNNVGLVRDAAGLMATLAWLRGRKRMSVDPLDIGRSECRNLLEVAYAITRAALARRESVGAHYRVDGVELERAAAAAG